MNLWFVVLGCSGGGTAPSVDPLPAVESKSLSGERPPDVVLISIDTLRPDHLGVYGHTRNTSPFLDGLAAKGVRFQHARSASPWTLPAHTTLFTGQLPTTHLVIEDDLRLADSVPVLPERLDERGVHTAGVVSTLFVSSMYGFDRGFDHFNDFGIHDKTTNLQGVVDTVGLVDDLEAYVKGIPSGEPMFLFLHTYDVHYAYDPPAPYDTMFDRAPTAADGDYRSYFYYKRNPLDREQLEHQLAQYDESIRYVDDQLARLDRVFRDAGREVRWVVTADHGEEFGERGAWGHAHTLYAEQLRVPLIVSGPGIPEGVVVEEAVGTHDIAPTLAAWAGIELPHVDGIDLNPYLSGETPAPARPFLAETSRHATMRLGLWEAGKRLDWDLNSGKRAIFADSTENAPTAEDPTAMGERLVELLGGHWGVGEPGAIAVRKGRVLMGSQARARVKVEGGERFSVYPFDAPVRFIPEGRKPGRAMAAAGGRRPVGALSFNGLIRPVDVDLDAETKAALESIGYIHDEE